jgi:hypothetical protein
MIAFLDFEASSLADESYPIEVGWVFEDGRGEHLLIRPAPQWTDWDPAAEAVHRISRAMLAADGVAHDVVAHRVLAELGGHEVYASAPSWDGKWLSVLLRGAGLPRHAMRLKDTDAAQAEAARRALGAVAAGDALEAVAAAVVARARQATAALPVRHRAQDDAERERQIWLEVRRLAEEEARTIAGRSSG